MKQIYQKPMWSVIGIAPTSKLLNASTELDGWATGPGLSRELEWEEEEE